MALSKDLILSQISEADIYRKYFGQFELKRLYKSPLREEGDPSFNIYIAANGKMCFKDFGGDQGDCFDFVSKLYNVNFRGAIAIVASDFGLSEDNLDFKPRQRRQHIPMVEITISRLKFEYEERPFPVFGEQIDFWEKYGITKDLLIEYDVHNITRLSYYNEAQKRIIERKARPFDPIFMYKYYEDEDVFRFYRPNTKFKGTKWVGNTRGYDIYGLRQIKEKVPLAGILAGQKDCISLFANTGIRAITCASESTEFTDETFEKLQEKSDKQFILYDNDKAGKKYAAKINERFGIPVVDISKITELKDTSDYFQHVIKHEDKEFLSDLIYSAF
jgi:hypothetical protein